MAAKTVDLYLIKGTHIKVRIPTDAAYSDAVKEVVVENKTDQEVTFRNSIINDKLNDLEYIETKTVDSEIKDNTITMSQYVDDDYDHQETEEVQEATEEPEVTGEVPISESIAKGRKRTKMSFGERAVDMGFLQIDDDKGLYSYSDRYGEIVYRVQGPIRGTGDFHPTDEMTTNILGIYTRRNPEDEFQYISYISDSYKFIGHDAINSRIRESLQEVGLPIIRENVILSPELTRLRNEIVVQSSQAHPQVGDVMPVMVVHNSYDGTRAAGVAFGIAIEPDYRFAFGLGEMKQIHLASSTTQVASAINSYMQVFTHDIIDMITQSFNKQLTDEEMLQTLDVIEGIGKNRRAEISKALEEMNPRVEGQAQQMPSAWQAFLAIVKYSSFEPNLNIKRLMENAAERVLVIPGRMYDVLEKIQKK